MNRFKYLLLIASLCFSINAWSQWSFTITCPKTEYTAGGSWTYTYSTYSQCEAGRVDKHGKILEGKFIPSQTSGTIVIFCDISPCRNSGGSVSPADISMGLPENNSGIRGAGSSFSNNPAYEIQYWAEDESKLMNIIGGAGNKGVSVMPKTNDNAFNKQLLADIDVFVLDEAYLSGARKFRPLNADDTSYDLLWRNVDMNNVNRYLSSLDRTNEPSIEDSDAYLSWLNQQFKEMTGIDMETLQNSPSYRMTNDEKQAILDYEVFATKLIDDKFKDLSDELHSIDLSIEKQDADLAILMLAPYGNAEEYLKYTNYRELTPSSIDISDPMRQVAEALAICNKTNEDTGWHAELYYNEITNKYVISCAGTDDQKDCLSDGSIALGASTPQYIMAKAVADAINNIRPEELRDNLDIEIVGHSLGGGVASIIGLATGKPTYTYNAAGVSTSTLKETGLLDKKESGKYRITAYHTDNDILTNAQSIAAKYNLGATAIGTPVNLGNLSEKSSEIKGAVVGAVIGAAIGVATVGAVSPSDVLGFASDGAKIGKGAVGHKSEPITKYFLNKSGESSLRCYQVNAIKNRYSASLDKVRGMSLSAHNYTLYDE